MESFLENERTLVQTFSGKLTMAYTLVLLQVTEEEDEKELAGGACRRIHGEFKEATVQNYVQKSELFW